MDSHFGGTCRMAQFGNGLQQLVILVHLPLIHQAGALQLVVQLSVSTPSKHDFGQNAHQRLVAHFPHALLVQHDPFRLVHVSAHVSLQIQLLVTRHAIDHLRITIAFHADRLDDGHEVLALSRVFHHALQLADVAFHGNDLHLVIELVRVQLLSLLVQIVDLLLGVDALV